MATNSTQLFDTVSKSKHTTEKRVMMGIPPVQKAVKWFKTDTTGLTSGGTIQHMNP